MEIRDGAKIEIVRRDRPVMSVVAKCQWCDTRKRILLSEGVQLEGSQDRHREPCSRCGFLTTWERVS